MNKKYNSQGNGGHVITARDQLACLLDEWKQNVELYIDQDKRGFDRIKMFLLIHAGLLVFFGKLFAETKESPILATSAAILISALGIGITFFTRRMSNRAHAFILLRKAQGMLIEKKIKEILSFGKEIPWRTSSGIVTTFTREHVAFIETDSEQWKPLKNEISELGSYASAPFSRGWKPSMGHLAWLNKIYLLIYMLWIGLVIVIVLHVWGSSLLSLIK